jgi:hypothetical protein
VRNRFSGKVKLQVRLGPELLRCRDHALRNRGLCPMLSPLCFLVQQNEDQAPHAQPWRAAYPMAVVSPMRPANPRFSGGSDTHRRAGMRIEIAGPDGPARKSNFSRLWTQRRLVRFRCLLHVHASSFATLHCLASSSARILEVPRRDIQTGPDAHATRRPLFAGFCLTRHSQAS